MTDPIEHLTTVIALGCMSISVCISLGCLSISLALNQVARAVRGEPEPDRSG
jgi:hypothetical protein